MKKNIDLKPNSSKRYGNELWVEIRKHYESKTHPSYERIKSEICHEFNLDAFPSQRTVERRAVKERWVRFVYDHSYKVASNKYSDDFWLCIRNIYETNPKIPYKRLKELVLNEMTCKEFPSHQAIAAMAKHKGWRRSDYLLKKSDATLKNLIHSVKNLESLNNFNENFETNENIKKQIVGYKDEASDMHDSVVIEEILECEKVSIENLLMKSKLKCKSQAEIILNSRKRMASLNDFGDLLSDSLVKISSELLSVVLRPDNFQKNAIKSMIQKLNDDLDNLSLIAEAYSNLSGSRRESIKFELALYGTQLEDLKEVDKTKRMRDLYDDKAYEEQRLRLVVEAERIAGRRRYIDSGGLEEEVNAEMKQRMKEVESDGCDIDDQDE